MFVLHTLAIIYDIICDCGSEEETGEGVEHPPLIYVMFPADLKHA